MVRSCDENGTKNRAWTVEEDVKLVTYVSRYGCWNWRQLPKFAGLSRCGKSCRQRWMNYLRPNIKRGNYSKEEEETIVKLHEILGNRWCAIAAHLPGRTGNEIKNLCKKRMNNTDETPSYPNLEAALDQRIKKAIFPNAESTTNSPQVTQTTDDHVDNWVNFVEDFNVSSMEAYTDNQFFNDFCTEPVLADNSYGPSGFYTPLMDSEFLHPLFNGDFL